MASFLILVTFEGPVNSFAWDIGLKRVVTEFWVFSLLLDSAGVDNTSLSSLEKEKAKWKISDVLAQVQNVP